MGVGLLCEVEITEPRESSAASMILGEGGG